MLKRGMRGLARATLITLTLGNACLAWAARAESPRPPNAAERTRGNVTMTWVSSETTTVAGEPLSYPSTPNPVISANVLTIAPGTVTQWMTHPAPAYVYVMEGTLTVEFAADGSRHEFKAPRPQRWLCSGSLPRSLRRCEGRAGYIASAEREPGSITRWVRHRREHDWDDRGRLFRCEDRRSRRDNDIDLDPNKLGGDLRETLRASLRPTNLDRDGAPLDPAEFAQPLLKSGNPLARSGTRLPA